MKPKLKSITTKTKISQKPVILKAIKNPLESSTSSLGMNTTNNSTRTNFTEDIDFTRGKKKLQPIEKIKIDCDLDLFRKNT